MISAPNPETAVAADLGQAQHGQEGLDLGRTDVGAGRQPPSPPQTRPVGVKRFLRALHLSGRAQFRHHLQSPQQPLGFITNRLSPDARIAGKGNLVNGAYSVRRGHKKARPPERSGFRPPEAEIWIRPCRAGGGPGDHPGRGPSAWPGPSGPWRSWAQPSGSPWAGPTWPDIPQGSCCTWCAGAA